MPETAISAYTSGTADRIQDPESSGWRVSLFYALRLFGHVLKLSRRRIERHHDPILRHGRGAHHDLIDTPLQPAQFFIRDDPAEPDVALRLPFVRSLGGSPNPPRSRALRRAPRRPNLASYL
jgi:hypothetical protein